MCVTQSCFAIMPERSSSDGIFSNVSHRNQAMPVINICMVIVSRCLIADAASRAYFAINKGR